MIRSQTVCELCVKGKFPAAAPWPFPNRTRPQLLAALPVKLRESLIQTAIILDQQTMNELILEVEGHSKPLAQGLRHFVSGFRFDVILDALKSIE